MTKRYKNKIIYKEEKEEYYHNSKYNLKIHNSNIKLAGKGVFTEEPIPINSFIDFYTGDSYYNVKCGMYFVEISDIYGINAIAFPRCYMAMINDAYNSQYTNNCEIRIENDNIEIWSLRNIEKGEELFFSYGNEYWK
jgi:hypothetical protein